MTAFTFRPTGLQPYVTYRLDTASASPTPATLLDAGGVALPSAVLKASPQGDLGRVSAAQRVLYAKPLTGDGVVTTTGTPVTLTAVGGPSGGTTQSGSTAAPTLVGWAYANAYRLTSATRDANGVATVGAVEWPDGATGTYLTLHASATHLGKVDSYAVSHTLAGVTTFLTQPLVTRDGAGNITAQPALNVSTTGVLDTFTRGDSAASLGTADTGTGWSNLGTGAFGIASNQAYTSTTPVTHYYTTQDPGIADVQIQVKIAGTASANMGLFFRASALHTGYVLIPNDSGALKFYKATGTTSFTQLGTVTTTVAQNDVIRATAIGNALKAYVNGVEVLSITDSTYPTNTKHGLWAYGTASAGARLWDNFALLPAT